MANFNLTYTGEQVQQTLDKVGTLQTEVTTHKAESASKHIHSSGSNANGSYIKYDDGTILCFGVFQETISTSATGTTHSVASANYAFPATLIDVKLLSVVGRASSFIASSVRLKTGTAFQMQHHFNVAVVATAYYFDWFVIGRWK